LAAIRPAGDHPCTRPADRFDGTSTGLEVEQMAGASSGNIKYTGRTAVEPWSKRDIHHGNRVRRGCKCGDLKGNGRKVSTYTTNAHGRCRPIRHIQSDTFI